MSILQELLKLREDADAHLVQDIKDALENGDDYKAKALAKLASSPAKRKELMKLIDDELHKVEEGQKSDALQAAIAEVAAGRYPDNEDGSPHANADADDAEQPFDDDEVIAIGKKHGLNKKELSQLLRIADGPIGY